MSDVNVHANGSWLGDATEDFKKLPTWGKFAAIGVLILVAGIALYEYQKNKTSGGSGVVSAGQVASGQGLSGGTQSPFSLIPNSSGQGSSPLIPFGDTPILDGLGNLIGWQQPPPPTSPPPTPSPSPTPTPEPIPIGGGNPPRQTLTPVPNLSGKKIWQGGNGRWWTGTSAKNETLLNSLFPSGTKFNYTNNTLYATAPGDTQAKVGTVVTMGKAAPPPIHKVTQKSPPSPPKVVKK